MTFLEYFEQLPDIKLEIYSYSEDTIVKLVNKCIRQIPIDIKNFKEYDALLSHIARYSPFNENNEVISNLENIYATFFVNGPSKLRPSILLSGAASDTFLVNYISDFLNTNDYPPHAEPLCVLNNEITRLSFDNSPDTIYKIESLNNTIKRVNELSSCFEDTYEYNC